MIIQGNVAEYMPIGLPIFQQRVIGDIMNIKLSGIVGKPELRYTPDGKAVLTFSLGQYTGGNKTDGYKERAWVRCEAWEELAEANAGIEKGQVVTITGQAKTPRKWTDKSGVERDAGFEVVAREITQGDDFYITGKAEKFEEVF